MTEPDWTWAKGEEVLEGQPEELQDTDLDNELYIQNKMTRKIAVPISNGILDGHFGHCKEFALVLVEENGIKEISYVDAPPHQPGLLPAWLAERGATDIIAGGMGQRAKNLLNERGVNVFAGAPSLSPEELVEGFLQESLNFSANYCDHTTSRFCRA